MSMILEGLEKWPSLKKAYEFTLKATTADENGNYVEALKYYDIADACFIHAIKREASNDKDKQDIQNKRMEYNERVEQIRSFQF